MGILTAIATFIILTLVFIIKKENKMVNKETFTLHLASLGRHYRPTKNDVVDLRQYFLDKNGNLYSFNLDSWEIKPSDNRHILKCSDDTHDKQGNIINTLRGMSQAKVTVRRKDYDFKTLVKHNNNFKIEVKMKGDRHLTVVTPNLYRKVHNA